MAPLIRLVISFAPHKKIYIFGAEGAKRRERKAKKNLWIFCLQLSPGRDGKPETGALFVSRILRDLM
jgi:hypothetical protein